MSIHNKYHIKFNNNEDVNCKNIFERDFNQKIILNAKMYNELINLNNFILKEKVDATNEKIRLTIKDLMKSINKSKGKTTKIKKSMDLFKYLCINKWFVIDPENQVFSNTVKSKILEFIMKDFVKDKENRNKMIIFYLFLFNVKSITTNQSNNSIKRYYYDCKGINLDYSNTNLDYYLDNFN